MKNTKKTQDDLQDVALFIDLALDGLTIKKAKNRKDTYYVESNDGEVCYILSKENSIDKFINNVSVRSFVTPTFISDLQKILFGNE